jgi:hypothetical protein
VALDGGQRLELHVAAGLAQKAGQVALLIEGKRRSVATPRTRPRLSWIFSRPNLSRLGRGAHGAGEAAGVGEFGDIGENHPHAIEILDELGEDLEIARVELPV